MLSQKLMPNLKNYLVLLVTRAVSQPPPPRQYSPVRPVLVERAASPIRPPPPPPRYVRMPSPVSRTETEVRVVEEYYTTGKIRF